MSDNFHQSVNGGTGANHIMFGHADAIWFMRRQWQSGRTAEWPAGVRRHGPDAGIVNEIENPNPAPGTNNWYTEDGYGGAMRLSAAHAAGLRRRLLHQLRRYRPSPASSRSRTI